MMISRKFLYGRLIMQVVPCGSTWLGIQLTKLAFNFEAAAKVARLRLQAPLRSTRSYSCYRVLRTLDSSFAHIPDNSSHPKAPNLLVLPIAAFGLS